MLEVLKADYRRHGSSLRNTALWAVAVYRFGNWSSSLGSPLARKLTSGLYGLLFLFVDMASGIQLNREARIGADFHLVHSGNVKIHPRSVIGDRVGIMHDVTLGTNMDREGAPTLGNDVFVGAGAKILGPVHVGDGARIAANSLVIADVPAGATAIGVPARALKYTGRTDETKPAAATTSPGE
jgi:serine O-acetyltransferase